MEKTNTFEDSEMTARYLKGMERPRPFKAARVILAGGAIKWFLNLLVGIALIALSISAAASIAGEVSIIAVVVILAFLGYVIFRLFQRIREPFLRTRLLRNGEVMVLPVVKRIGTSGVLSKFGVKSRTTYSLRCGEDPESPIVEAVFDGPLRYQGDTCVVLYEGSGKENVDRHGLIPPKHFFALDCFLFHRVLTFPDLLERNEKKRARSIG